MALKEYQHKRNFKKTPEPKGKDRSIKKSHPLIFVIQKHAASHLHYDFRLEINGTLKSWAVPKGPSLDPKQKRLAMQVEDHPLEYANFEGIIPKGEYGGGTVMIWDHGIWEPIGDYEQSYNKGKLEFILHGKKLKGKWILLRIARDKKPSWLLVKVADAESCDSNKYDILKEQPLSVITQRDLSEIAENKALQKSNVNQAYLKPLQKIKAFLQKNKAAKAIAQLPTFSPQLAVLVDKAPQGDKWLHEVKFDGYRLLAYFINGQLKLITRNGHDWTHKLQPIVEAFKSMALMDTVLDGELVAIDKNNHISFQLLQNAINFNKPAKLVYYVFDMPFYLGFDIRGIALLERKRFLQQLLKIKKLPSTIQYSDHVQGSGDVTWETSCELGLEGIISKYIASPYESRRTKNWLKIKCVHQQEFLIIGFLHSKKRSFSSLLLGYYDDSSVHYCGHVGTGFSHETSENLLKKLIPLTQKKHFYKNVLSTINKKDTVWVKPELIAEIKFSEWTEEGALRHPVFLGLRTDKDPTEIKREQTISVDTASAKNSKTKTKRVLNKAEKEDYLTKNILTNKNKIVFTGKNLNKKDLADYYLSISQWILPYIVNRPLMLLRCPSGQEKNCFYQKHGKDDLPKGIFTVDIKEKNDTKPCLYIKDEAGLIALSQLAVIEIHIWGSNIDAIEQPDHMVFDLDPGPGVTWDEILQAAYRLHEELLQKNLTSFVKTSGKKGLHVVVPLMPNAKWDIVKEYARGIAMNLAKKYPNEYVATMTKEKRRQKIFIDFFRNGRGSTTVAPYSCRANNTASVSLPLSWRELETIPAANYFDMVSTVQKFKKKAKDPWQDFFKQQRKNKL